MQQENSSLLFTINYDLLDIFNGELLELFTKYSQMNIFSIEDRPELARAIKLCVDMFETHSNHPEVPVMECIELFENMSEEKIKQLFDKMLPDKIYGILHNWKSTIENAEAEDILQYTDIDNAFCDNIVADENSSRDEIIDAYTRRFFGISYSAANNMIKLYGCGAKELISKYANKDQLSTDEQMELSALKQLVYLSEIINFEDVQILRDNYKELIQDKNMTDINYMAICMQEEYIKCAYTKEKNSMLYKLNQHEADESDSLDK